jgi:hypothetical protein
MIRPWCKSFLITHFVELEDIRNSSTPRIQFRVPGFEARGRSSKFDSKAKVPETTNEKHLDFFID